LHQIRVHFAQLGFPVVDDEFYTRFGAIKDSAAVPEWSRAGPRLHTPLLGRQALHAASIELTHPVTRVRLCGTAPLPADLGSLIDALRKPQPVIPPTSYSPLPTNATA
jgi:23S rRNA-/tRNA-specific pseudouridylate synthase